MKEKLGDMPIEEFKKQGHMLIDWIADYLDNIEKYPVLAQIKPGDVKSKLPAEPPAEGEEFTEFMKDVDDIIMPGMTHWNHPNFMAYFNSTGTGPGILAELLSGAFNINGMLWKSSPAATELEEVTLGWLRQMLKLPEDFWGIIYDGAANSTMHALAAAREYASDLNVRQKGMAGRSDIPRLRVYASEQAHNSIDKGALTIGIGLDGIRHIPVDKNFSMIAAELEKAIKEDVDNGWYPLCVVVSIGTTSTTSIDPLPEIGRICKANNIWLHVDAAHAGTAAIVPEMRYILNGIELADSLVVNPHKWMGIPIDLSTFFTNKPEVLRGAFSLSAEYLKTKEDASVENYMDYGIQLGRRFRSLKLWFVIRYFGVNGIIDRLKDNLRLAQLVKKKVEENSHFELLAPVPLSTVCFRVNYEGKTDEVLNELNANLMHRVNATGKVFLSHTVLNGKFAIRFVVSSFKTMESHVELAWNTILETFEELKKEKKI